MSSSLAFIHLADAFIQSNLKSFLRFTFYLCVCVCVCVHSLGISPLTLMLLVPGSLSSNY